jgi:hypothetical protein
MVGKGLDDKMLTGPSFLPYIYTYHIHRYIIYKCMISFKIIVVFPFLFFILGFLKSNLSPKASFLWDSYFLLYC